MIGRVAVAMYNEGMFSSLEALDIAPKSKL
jgi:hypothetical protein